MTEQTEAKTAIWRNRIVGTAEVDPHVLKANPRNWRKHPKQQQDVLEGVLEEVGWVDQILVNRRTGLMIDGHLRVELAVKRKEKTVPVNYVDLSPEEEALILATFDPISAMATRDSTMLRDLVASLSPSSDALASMFDKVLETYRPGGDSLAKDGSKWADPQTLVVYGDVWKLGEHVLFCRDLFEDHQVWSKELKEGDTFLPYPGPYAAHRQGFEGRMVMVQPDPWIAGHLIDRFKETGAGAVEKLS